MATPDAPATVATASGAGLRVVLFGRPGAGKSSLLGALAQAGQTQEHLVNGRLNDLSHRLAALQTRLYDGAPQPTEAEIVPYPILLESFDHGNEPIRAVVFDSDGRVANELVANPELLDGAAAPRPLAEELNGADALVLLVDASALPEQLEADFAAFDRFLRGMEFGRSARTDVGGLPVFIVLTKCDLLARAGDTTADWMERIEQRKREVGAHFREFLIRRERESGPPPFGELDLHLWATAVKRPALASAPAKPREPYGVAELFRQCLDLAAEYRRSVRRSTRRLYLIVSAAGGALGALLLVALFLLFWPAPPPPSALQRAVEAMQLSESGKPADRLSAPLAELRMRRDMLHDWQSDRDFAALPKELRDFVVNRYNELDRYIDWFEEVRAQGRPVSADTEKELRERKEQLDKLHAGLDPDWGDTPAARLLKERIDEADALLAGVKHVKTAYLGDPEAAVRLWSFEGYRRDSEAREINWAEWQRDLAKLPPQAKPETGPLPGAPSLTYAAVTRLDTVQDAMTLRPRLERVRDLCAALGLISVPDRPPALAVPRPPGFKVSDAAGRMRQLRDKYPNHKTEFSRTGLPDALLPEVDRAVAANYDNLLDPARDLVLSRLQKAGTGDAETPARWHAVRDWLRDTTELADWRALAAVLLHIQDPHARDPVTALADFLNETTFPLDINRVVLELPDELRGQVPSTSELVIYHEHDGKRSSMVFKQTGEPRRDPDRRVTAFTFELRKDNRIVYQPGDDLWVTLPLTDKMQLTWKALNRSTRYQFERLLRPPRRHREDRDPKTGDLVEDVRVQVFPAEGWPRVPDLLPVVRLTR
jgi:hypothetical protein